MSILKEILRSLPEKRFYWWWEQALCGCPANVWGQARRLRASTKNCHFDDYCTSALAILTRCCGALWPKLHLWCYFRLDSKPECYAILSRHNLLLNKFYLLLVCRIYGLIMAPHCAAFLSISLIKLSLPSIYPSILCGYFSANSRFSSLYLCATSGWAIK